MRNRNAHLTGSVLPRPGVPDSGNGNGNGTGINKERSKPGPKPKLGIAMTPAQRQAKLRKLKRQAAQDRRLKQWQQGLGEKFDKENSVNRGRLHSESSHAPENLEAIRHAQNRDALTGGVSPEQLAEISTWQREAPTGGGKRVRPEGYGNYKSSDYSGNESQIANPVRAIEVQQSGKFNLREFVEGHFRQILYCAWPPEKAPGPEGKEVPAWDCYLQCRLCPYETTPARLYSNTLIVRAKTHVRSYHLTEFQNWQGVDEDRLPAWLDPLREKQLRGEPLKSECPIKAKHEEWRLKAKERYEQAVNLMPDVLKIETQADDADYELIEFGRSLRDRMKESVVCPTCRAPVFLPPEVAPKPDMKPLSHHKRDVPSGGVAGIVGIQDARLALRIAMNLCIDTCSPDLDED